MQPPKNEIPASLMEGKKAPFRNSSLLILVCLQRRHALSKTKLCHSRVCCIDIPSSDSKLKQCAESPRKAAGSVGVTCQHFLLKRHFLL